jgi:hypothetical protein
MTRIALAVGAATVAFLAVPALADPVSTTEKPIVVAQVGVDVRVGGDRHRDFHRYHRDRIVVGRPHRDRDIVVIRRHRHYD